ncbi:MAG: hypothetical protein HY216_17035, partial [Candidatus Rokubacteria bacterium]|nr:hypothetical protein [Candidatus Rokubacteria bacterium]
MSARDASVYRCQHCGFASPKPGTCPDCRRTENAFHELVEERPQPRGPATTRRAGAPTGRPRPLRDIVLETRDRVGTGIGELDRVLGGGVVAGSLVLIGGDPGIGKCVTGDTRVLDPQTGAYWPITQWNERRAPVLALNPASLQLSVAMVSGFREQGVHEVVELETTLGRSLRCTPDHPLFTPDGWKAVRELKPGDRLAAPRELACFGDVSMAEAAIKLVAYTLSDGSAQSQISVTTELPEVVADLEQIAAAFDVELVAYDKPRNNARQYR